MGDNAADHQHAVERQEIAADEREERFFGLRSTSSGSSSGAIVRRSQEALQRSRDALERSRTGLERLGALLEREGAEWHRDEAAVEVR